MAKNIKYILFVASIVALLFPLSVIYLIFPSFKTVLVDNIKDEAVRIAKHFSPFVVSASKDELKNVDEFADELQILAHQFNFEKVKVFNKAGEVIYSSSPEEIGKINNKAFFREIVAKGEVYAEVVTIGKQSAEGITVTSDVVEAYIPIMTNNTFIGAFEVYYDITNKLQALNSVAIRLSKISIILMFIFLISIIVVVLRSDRKIAGTYVSPFGRKRYRSAVFNISIIGAFLFFGEVIVMLAIHPLKISSSILESFFDATLLMLLVSPALYFFMMRPLLEHISERKKLEQERERLISELKESLENIKTLKGLIPICASCKKIRNDEGFWSHFETYISEHTDAQLSHGICPDCMKELYPEYHKKNLKEKNSDHPKNRRSNLSFRTN